MNEAEIIPESDSTPKGVSNYMFMNIFTTSVVFMVDLRTGYIIKEWDFADIVHD